MIPPDGPPPAPPPPPAGGYNPSAYYPGAQPSNGIAVAAGVLGIIGVVLMWVPFINFAALILGVLATIFGIVGMGRANHLGGAGRGMAITGLVCGIVSLAVSLLFILAIYSIVSHVSPG